MATFDLQHFFETRQELASRTGSLYAQREVANIRESLREEQLKTKQPEVAKKATEKATKKEKGAK